MEIRKTKENGKLTLSVSGRVDTTTAPSLEASVNEDIDGVSDFEFDFSELEYISSAGLRVILSTQKKMNGKGTLTVAHANADIREIFDITGFTDILTLKD